MKLLVLLVLVGYDYLMFQIGMTNCGGKDIYDLVHSMDNSGLAMFLFLLIAPNIMAIVALPLAGE